MVAGSRPGVRLINSRTTSAARSSGRTADSAPQKPKPKAAKPKESEAAVPKIIKEAKEAAKEAKKASLKAAAEVEAASSIDVADRPVSAGKVAALFSEWRARRAHIDE